ncbi:type II toxin-antitoxin system HipA family toxin [Ensifer adhaerens]|uniref:type II toxin-antitoxin system HipA family toxin n=1 Tax=Ensifer adhaerens TaxID=106592 RepID=UPI001CBBD822|nr:HipA domain-containing protein [Ensifer adhaerens]MBZ7927582.1 HipA domain-containing protein [Ensifer adhaerens]
MFKDEDVGVLSETASGGTRFSYDAEWRGDIACCFSSERREHDWINGLHPFFQHLGPEGWLREQQARLAHIVEDDDFGLLLRYGRDCIGAVSVVPTEELVDFGNATPTTANPGRTVSGHQKKLLVVKTPGGFEPASATGPAPYIAKFNSERLPTLVRNENLSLQWAAVVLGKGEVNEFALSFVPAVREQALIVTRFDRKGQSKLRLEDFAQILSVPRGADYAGKYNASYEDAAEVIKRYSTRSQIDLLRFFRRLVAFAIVGNCDAHLKNFSLLETSTGLRLSPAYDVLNTAIYDGYDQTLALSLGGDKINLDVLTDAHFRRFGRSIGLPDRVVDIVFAELRRNVVKAAPIIRPPEAEGGEGFLTSYEEIVSNSCQRILGVYPR